MSSNQKIIVAFQFSVKAVFRFSVGLIEIAEQLGLVVLFS